MLEKAGRLTSGNSELHERRAGLANVIMECHTSLSVMLRNWPGEYEIPPEHNLIELMEVMAIVAEDLEMEPNEETDNPKID
jgi:hypothetical protein